MPKDSLSQDNNGLVPGLITVFVPTGNRADSLAKVLGSLVSQTYKNFEVVVVDYRSTDETRIVADKFGTAIGIRFVEQETKGLSRAANQALNIARGEIFIRTDDDVIMSPGWLEAIHETFNSDPKVGGVTGPTVVPPDNLGTRDLFYFEEKFRQGNIFFRLIGKLYFDYFLEGEPYRVSHWCKCGTFTLGANYETALAEEVQEVNNLEACNFAVRTALLRRIGSFDTSYLELGEYHEPDAAFKIMGLGYKLVFNPKVFLNHCPSQEGFFKDRPSSYTRMTNFIKFYTRHIKPNTFDKFLRFSLYLTFLNTYYVFKGLQKRQINQLGAVPATFVGLTRALFASVTLRKKNSLT